MIELIIGYGSIIIVSLWLILMIIRDRRYSTTSLKNCNLDCRTCRFGCQDGQSANFIGDDKKAEPENGASCCR